MSINYKLEGEGKTLVFIHGLSDNLLYWQPLINGIKNHYRILRYDLRGHGLSEWKNEKISMNTYVDDLNCLLNKLEINSVNLVGFSLGGAIALDFAIKYPQRVSSLVLISSFYKSDQHLSDVFNTLKQSLEKGFPEFFETILPMVLCPKVIRENREELNMIKHAASETANLQAYSKSVDVCLSFNVEDKLHYIEVPTLIIAAKYDDFTLQSMQQELHDKIRNSKMTVFDNVKHNILIGKNIEKLSDMLINFHNSME